MWSSIRIHTASKKPSNEQGAVLLTFVAVVATMFILLGLAVDTGNLYTARLVSQASVDAAAISGAGLIARGKTDAQAIQGAQEIAEANLRIMGIKAPWRNGAPIVQLGGNRMTVTVSSNVPLHILKILPGANHRTVAAQATAQISPAAVAVVLDTSDSMSCPARPADPTKPCACIPNCPNGANSGAKIEELRIAVKAFLTYFNEGRDSISLTAFGHGAETLVKAKTSGFKLDEMNSAINALEPHGGTNVCDGFIRAYLEMDRIDRAGDAAYVYFSDGAPTAGRFFFRNPRNGNSIKYKNNQLNKPWSRYDYLSWGVIQQGTDPDGNQIYVPVPQRLYKTPPETSGGYDYWNPREFGEMVPPDPPSVTVPYGNYVRVPTERPWEAFSDAVRDMTIYLPNGSTKKLGRQSLWENNNYKWNKWEPAYEHLMIYADCALAMADFMREAGANLYGIGYGPAAPKKLDPYQDAIQSHIRKDYFMTRITNDPCGLVENHPPFPGIPTLQQMATTLVSNGTYYPVADADRLKGLFERIAVKIKLRLIS